MAHYSKCSALCVQDGKSWKSKERYSTIESNLYNLRIVNVGIRSPHWVMGGIAGWRCEE